MIYLHSLALQASSYKLRFSVNEESAVDMIVKNRKTELKSIAYFRKKFTIEDVMNLEYEIGSLRNLMIPKTIVSAIAVIVVSEEDAKRNAK